MPCTADSSDSFSASSGEPGLVEPQFGHLDQQPFLRRQELVHRRVDQADGDGQGVHGPEQAVEVRTLEGQQDRQGRVALDLGLGQDHLLHGGQAVGLEEHVLGAGQADALGAEAAGALRVHRVVGVGPHAQRAQLVGPAQQLDQVRILDVGGLVSILPVKISPVVPSSENQSPS